ncbi:MAG: SAM-dependent methyltransferase [Pseudomonadota bacterium]
MRDIEYGVPHRACPLDARLMVAQKKPPRMIDKRRLSLAVARAQRLQKERVGSDFLMQRMADELADRMAVINRTFEAPLLIAPNHPAITVALAPKVSGQITMIHEPDMFDEVLKAPRDDHDLIVTLGQLHLLDDVPGMLAQMERAMRPDGLLLACVPGAGSMDVARNALLAAEESITGGAAQRFMPLIDVRSAGALLQRAGFALPVADVDEVNVRYSDIKNLVGDLRAMSATNFRLSEHPVPLRRGVWKRFCEEMAQSADENERVSVGFHMVWMSGWAKADTQPKPLQPGSAEKSLSAVLGRRQAK